jgi:hypothetical protein
LRRNIYEGRAITLRVIEILQGFARGLDIRQRLVLPQQWIQQPFDVPAWEHGIAEHAVFQHVECLFGGAGGRGRRSGALCQGRGAWKNGESEQHPCPQAVWHFHAAIFLFIESRIEKRETDLKIKLASPEGEANIILNLLLLSAYGVTVAW